MAVQVLLQLVIFMTKQTVADLGGGMGGMHPPHQPKSNDFGRKISLYFE